MGLDLKNLVKSLTNKKNNNIIISVARRSIPLLTLTKKGKGKNLK
jgi:hypothetical protein